ncbi:MAG: hypothetical protein GX442_19575 [Candidatus Riflebacteria bacterium]|nr:hypothetical protein [Candidatus Riflebacteria bacterium]
MFQRLRQVWAEWGLLWLLSLLPLLSLHDAARGEGETRRRDHRRRVEQRFREVARGIQERSDPRTRLTDLAGRLHRGLQRGVAGTPGGGPGHSFDPARQVPWQVRRLSVPGIRITRLWVLAPAGNPPGRWQVLAGPGLETRSRGVLQAVFGAVAPGLPASTAHSRPERGGAVIRATVGGQEPGDRAWAGDRGRVGPAAVTPSGEDGILPDSLARQVKTLFGPGAGSGLFAEGGRGAPQAVICGRAPRFLVWNVVALPDRPPFGYLFLADPGPDPAGRMARQAHPGRGGGGLAGGRPAVAGGRSLHHPRWPGHPAGMVHRSVAGRYPALGSRHARPAEPAECHS